MLEWLFPTFTSCVVCDREDTSSVTCGVCRECYEKLPWSDSPMAVFAYTEPVVKLIHQLKYNNKRYLAKVLTRLGKDKLDSFEYDLITFVPSFDKRRRGYVQGEYLARVVDDKKTINTLKKIKDIPSQTELDRKQRLENVKQAFIVPSPTLVKGKRVLLVDDVLTTGATTQECKRILLAAGATSVQVFSVCVTEDN